MQTLSEIQLPETDDSDLLRRLLDRDETALMELRARYHSILAGTIMKVIHDSAECDDILQDVLIQVWERIGTFEPAKGKLCSWLTTVARRRAIDHVRRIAAYRRASDRYEIECTHGYASAVSDRGDEIAESDVRNLLDRELDLLPLMQGQAIRLSYLEGRSQREIAAMLHTPLGTIKTRIELGLKKLTRALCDSRSLFA